ncbi:MAG: hypothetical protein JOZ62_17910 [Acidobacteriaceae bacterium]|nr:hypothetical protein [Acidobacteriaceae bacterium]
MAQPADSVSWWLIPLPGLLISALMVLVMWIAMRERRWRDRKFLARAVTMPPEHVAAEPRTVRDLSVGEEAYVDRYAVVSSRRKRRVYVRWDARVTDAPADSNSAFAPLRIRRLKRGFSLTVRPGNEFRTSPVPWGWYAPVIEIIQAAPSAAEKSWKGNAPGFAK